MNLDIGANRQIDESQVPEHLKHLIPIVNKWSFESLEDQDKFVKQMLAKRPEEVKEFNILYDTHRDQLHEWVCSLPKTDKSKMTEKDWAHPQWAFISLYKIREITGDGIESEEEKLAAERLKTEIRSYKFEQICIKADTAFQKRQFTEYVNLLSSYLDLLSEVQKKKLLFAKKRSKTE